MITPLVYKAKGRRDSDSRGGLQQLAYINLRRYIVALFFQQIIDFVFSGVLDVAGLFRNGVLYV
ncbi:MAG: hypothetical protein K2M77_04200, partial [Muribaculaceae bacterium]|nr:hypothetical protein [Muribaculaceae bacterium]